MTAHKLPRQYVYKGASFENRRYTEGTENSIHTILLVTSSFLILVKYIQG